MIQLHQNALLVCSHNGRVEPIHIQDLLDRLLRENEIAALKLQPWILEKVVESIFYHFRNERNRDRIAFNELVDLAKLLLEGFFREVVQKDMGFPKINLFDVASRCGMRFELEFFTEIKRSLMNAMQIYQEKVGDHESEKKESSSSIKPGENLLRISGLRNCAKYLSGKQRWSKRCSEMRDEIIVFIRQEALRMGSPNLAIAVLS